MSDNDRKMFRLMNFSNGRQIFLIQILVEFLRILILELEPQYGNAELNFIKNDLLVSEGGCQ